MNELRDPSNGSEDFIEKDTTKPLDHPFLESTPRSGSTEPTICGRGVTPSDFNSNHLLSQSRRPFANHRRSTGTNAGPTFAISNPCSLCMFSIAKSTYHACESKGSMNVSVRTCS